MRTDLYKLEDVVKKVLVEYPDTRADDFILIYRVYKEVNEECVIRNLFFDVMLNHRQYGLPHFSSIERCRRKVFQKCPELKPKKITMLRKESEANYIDYAINS